MPTRPIWWHRSSGPDSRLKTSVCRKCGDLGRGPLRSIRLGNVQLPLDAPIRWTRLMFR